MPGQKSSSKGGSQSHPSSPGSSSTRQRNFDYEEFQSQLWDLCNEEDNVFQMQALFADSKKMKMSAEDRTCINVCGLIAPFMISAKALTESLGAVKENIDRNRCNIRLLAFANERLEQYTRRDNLRLFGFPACEDSELRGNFINQCKLLGVDVQDRDISVIHHFPSKAALKHVIVRFNNRMFRNKVLFSKKDPLNTDGCPFKGVYIQEDQTTQRSKMVRFIKANDNVERVRTTDGKIHVTLKADKGSGNKVVIDNPDDLFRMGFDIAATDLKQFGFNDI